MEAKTLFSEIKKIDEEKMAHLKKTIYTSSFLPMPNKILDYYESNR